MQKKDYTLSLLFSSKDKEVFYQGISRYNSKVIDSLEVTASEIKIRFSRTAKKNPEEYVYSESSPVRYQLYRAACFYLAVVGFLPKVRRIVLRTDKLQTELDKALLIQSWDDCRIKITLPIETAARCFSEEDKKYYTIITYFLKAQLDPFHHDAFRAAWSGLNGIYSELSESQYEKDKLSAMSEILRIHRATNAEEYAKTLDTDFWRHVQWHNYVQWRTMPKVEEAIMNNRYPDLMVYKGLADYLISIYKKTNQTEKAQRIEQYAQARIKKKVTNTNDRVRFLVTEYCYMIRNRSFHAGKPYPIFNMKNADKKTTEQQLTELILLVIRDILVQRII